MVYKQNTLDREIIFLEINLMLDEKRFKCNSKTFIKNLKIQSRFNYEIGTALLSYIPKS